MTIDSHDGRRSWVSGVLGRAVLFMIAKRGCYRRHTDCLQHLYGIDTAGVKRYVQSVDSIESEFPRGKLMGEFIPSNFQVSRILACQGKREGPEVENT